MKPPQQLHDLGQSLWLDTITRDLLTSSTLKHYIDALSVTGLTSNPTIFDHAIKNTNYYDDAIREKVEAGKHGQELFFELALEDLGQAADLLDPIFERTNRMDGWVSLEVSPHLAYAPASTLAEARKLHAQTNRPNVFIKIPGTQAGLEAIEEAIFEGVPVNVTLLFSREQYLAAAGAYLRGIERRIAAGLNPDVPSVASLFISRWDKATMGRAPRWLQNRLGIAVAQRTYQAYREVLNSARWLRLANEGARPQRLLWASTGTKDPDASDYMYVKALAAPLTINTMPEETLRAFADHGELADMLPVDGGHSDQVIAQFSAAGITYEVLADELQVEGAAAFVNSWDDLMTVIAEKSAALAQPS
jgi:transaldolase